MPELFAVITTAAHVVGYAVLLILLAAIVMPVLVGLLIVIAYAVCVIRGAIEWVTDGEGEAE